MSIFSSKAKYNKVITDSRKIKEGDIFLALKGEKFDAHDFLNQVLEKGAQLIFSEKEHSDPRVKVVKNTLQTYHQLANEYRKLINPITIAITGSSGKTTLKELLIKVLETKYKVHATQANFNNEIGVPQTILSMPEDTEVLIVEMGMRGLGEIELLSKTTEPDIAVITNIGTAHIERLGSVDNIRKAKLEIISGVKQGGQVLVDAILFKDLENKYPNLKLNQFSSCAINNLDPNYLISAGLLASMNAATVVAKSLKLTEQQIQEGINNYRPGPGRGEFIYKEDDLYIDETYNSNPEAVRNSVYAMLKQFPNDHKIATLGPIMESDPKLIEELFTELKEYEDDKFKIISAKTYEEAREQLAEVKSNKKNIILVKASRAAKFEQLLPASNSVNTTH